jgi:hypothetical protein
MTFDPSKPVQTRDGRPARILATDMKSDRGYCIAAAIGGSNEFVETFTSDGRVIASPPFRDRGVDLVNIPERLTVRRWAKVSSYDPKTVSTNARRSPAYTTPIDFFLEDGKIVDVKLGSEDEVSIPNC